jgi:AmiR/NasT family two-component response regulator
MTEQESWRYIQTQAMQNRVTVGKIAQRVIDGELAP